jgi:lipoprotein-anchoring transpeptidase ErfK/SrfK
MKFATKLGSIRVALLAAFAVSALADAAEARLLSWPQFGSWWGVHSSPRHGHRHRQPKPASATTDQAAEIPNGPLQIIISIPDQRISVYDNDALIARSSVSTGVRGHPTPLGVFSVISKQRWHHSNLYSGAPMPYMQRITWSGIALHAGIVPGHPASHGCIRLKHDFAIRLWGLTKRGARVIIAPGDVRPVEIAHPRLFISKANVAFRSPDAQAVTRDGGAIKIAAAAPSTSNTDEQQVADLEPPGFTPAAVPPRKFTPVSVFVSRKLSRLFVRQGFMPLFDTSVKIQDPEQSLGTHVFTLMGSENEPERLRWTVVSMPEADKLFISRSRFKQVAESDPPLSSPDKANAALNRIEIPQDVVARISELLTPGSSLIVSDFAVSGETGKGTDFIVLTK